jgi:hypothetical protein
LRSNKQTFLAAGWRRFSLAFLFVLLAFVEPLVAADFSTVYPQVRSIFPDAQAFGGFELNPPSVAVYRDGQAIGYVFLTGDVLRIPAYSGKPINTMVGIDMEGRIVGLSIVHHDEPILAVGIPQERLSRHVAQYVGLSSFDKVTIGTKRDGYVSLDGISGATITVMVENSTVMRAARAIAESRGIRHPALPPLAKSDVVPPLVPAAERAPSVERPAAPIVLPPPAVAGETIAPVAASNVKLEKPTVKMREKPVVQKPPASPPSALPAGVVVPLSVDMPPAYVPPIVPNPTTWTPPKEEPEWVSIWRNRTFDIAVLLIGLGMLFLILIFQDWLARHPVALTYIRNAFHLYTLFFIGWWGLAQLSVANVLTFVNAAMHGFNWENFLIDPMLFILWSFVAVTLLLWGRGVYCGWLCPFGALQELTLLVARRFKLPAWEFPDVVHERLWAIKYIALIVLFGLSLQSLTEAAVFAEMEPFKTVFALRFDREPIFVLYALMLIGISFFNRKFYCKYLCTLGAALAIPGRFRLFEWWLRRRKECGKPCQVCANRCSVQAIRPTGEINANECHYCLDCQVIYYNDQTCLPLVDRRKKRESRMSPPADSPA